MDIVIRNDSGTPIYMQLYEQISAQIMRGELEGDSSLPPIRTVAKELRVSVIPVKRAWEELERGGFIYTMAGKGCFVSPHKNAELDNKRDAIVTKKLRADVEYYKSLGIALDELVEMISDCYNSENR